MAIKSPRKEIYDLVGKYGLKGTVYLLTTHELDMVEYLREIEKDYELADLHYKSYQVLADALLELSKIWGRR